MTRRRSRVTLPRPVGLRDVNKLGNTRHKAARSYPVASDIKSNPSNSKMQSTIFLALLSTAILPFAVLAAPTEMSPRLEPLASSLETRQFYDGPCSHTDCGVTRINCRDRRMWCVAYPSFDAPEGCTCSNL
ncbi:hypothetical protein GGR51DRAFT_499362 [Nemania sp. FL0031]|nr:hypothetical protein GGR51DRAFT_499362 [Nemania sp. FL0031]